MPHTRRDFILNSFWITTRYVVVALSGVIISIAFARLAAKETYGSYQLILSLLAMFSVLSLPGLNMAVLKEVANNNPVVLREGIRRSFMSSLWGAVALALIAAYWFVTGKEALAGTLLVASIFFPFFYAPNTWYTYYEGQSQFLPVTIRVIISTLWVTLALMLGLWWQLPLIGLIVLYLGMSSLFSLVYYWQIRHTLLTKTALRPLDLKFGKRVTVQKFVYSLTENLPTLIIGGLLGAASVADFQIAIVFLTGVSGLLSALTAMSLPYFFTDTTHSHRSLLWQNVGVGVLACIGYWIVVRLFFQMIYGDIYAESFALAQLLIGVPLLVSLKTFLVNYYTALDRNRFIITLYIVANVLAAVLFVTLIHRTEFRVASSIYLYGVNALLVVPFLAHYFLRSEPTQSDNSKTSVPKS